MNLLAVVELREKDLFICDFPHLASIKIKVPVATRTLSNATSISSTKYGTPKTTTMLVGKFNWDSRPVRDH